MAEGWKGLMEERVEEGGGGRVDETDGGKGGRG